MGLLDALANSNLGGFGGLLDGIYMPSQIKPGQMQYDQMGNPIGATQQTENNFTLPPLPMPTAPQGPSQMSVQPPVFGFGASGFSPTQNGTAIPSQIAPPQRAPQAPVAPPTDVSSQSIQPSRTLDIGGYQMPQFGNAAPQQQIPAQAQPTQYQSPQPQTFGADSPSLSDKLLAGFTNFGAGGKSGGLIGALAGAGTGFATGQRQDSAGLQQQQLSATFQSLVGSGVPKNLAMAAALNPEILKQIAPQYFSKPELKLVKDAFGTEQPYVWDATEQTLKPANTGQASSGTNQTPQMLEMISNISKAGTTQEKLAAIPEQYRGYVQSMLTGRALPANIGRSPVRAQLVTLAHEIDPTFDEASIPARVKGYNDWYGGGASSNTARSLNQSALHFGELVNDKMQELPGHQVPLANSAINSFNTQVLGKGAEGNFLVNAHALADELGGLFKGHNLSDTEIRAWESRLTPDMSLEQQRGMAKTLLGLYRDGAAALEKKRVESIGPIAAAERGPLLGEEQQRVLKQIEDFANGRTGRNATNTSQLPSGWSVKVR